MPTSGNNITVFFVSESTAITAVNFGKSILSQFDDVHFVHRMMPYINTPEAAVKLIESVNEVYERDKVKPIIIASMPLKPIDFLLRNANAHYYEIFQTYIDRINVDIGLHSYSKTGLSHAIGEQHSYDRRMDSIHYAMEHDDASSFKRIDAADIILLGVSRSGKTPTCLYLALQFGILVANYPLTDDDFGKQALPDVIVKNMHKAIALNINPARLQTIRQKRHPDRKYSSLEQCQYETRIALDIYYKYDVPILDSSSSSIEELASKIISLSAINIEEYNDHSN